MELRNVTHRSPDGDKEQVLRFWSGEYAEATRSRLEAPWGSETYGLAAAFEAGRCIGTTSYTISPHRVGILSQVFTDADHRGRGVGRATISAAIATFRQQRTRAVYLASAKEWVRAIYRSVGFEFVGAMGERHAFKLTLDESGREEILFRPGQPVAQRALATHDQADLSALFNSGHDCLVKHHELGCYLGSHFEGEFYQLRRLAKARPGFRAVILEGQETLLGLATVVPSARRGETHRGVVDVLVRPGFADHGGAMMAALHEDSALEVYTAYAGEGDALRCALLEGAGYTVVGRLAGWLRFSDTSCDLLLFERGRGAAT
jgi:GNAT superfamily N-acetyltransferase